MKNYKMSTEGMVFLAGVEGMALTKYLDSVNVHTISVGVTKSDIPDLDSWPWTKELTIKEAMDYFDKALTKYVNAVNKALRVPVRQHQFDALVSICFNIGTSGMANSTFMKRINAKASDSSIRSAMMSWVKAGGKTLPGLVTRRTKEANLYLYGDYGNGKVNLFPVDPKSHRPIYSKGKSIDVKKYLESSAEVVEKEAEKIPETIDKTPSTGVEYNQEVEQRTGNTGWDFIISLIKAVFGGKK
jgi:lysozyme